MTKIPVTVVYDSGKIRFWNAVTDERLERVSPSSTAPLLWQVSYLISHTKVKDIMQTDVVTIDLDATVEQGVQLAQSRKVGALIVVKDNKVKGIVTTNDFFYNIINPVLGIGQSGTRISIPSGGSGKDAAKIIGAINKLGVEIKILCAVPPSRSTKTHDLTIHLDTDDATPVTSKLQELGYKPYVIPREPVSIK